MAGDVVVGGEGPKAPRSVIRATPADAPPGFVHTAKRFESRGRPGVLVLIQINQRLITVTQAL